MKKTVTEDMFVDAFTGAGRGDQFSVSGRRALFEYLEEIDREGAEEMELDVIAICCEFAEYENALEAVSEYSGFEADEDASIEAREAAALEWLQDRTTVITHDGGVIIAHF
jgi:hypothetical protein